MLSGFTPRTPFINHRSDPLLDVDSRVRAAVWPLSITRIVSTTAGGMRQCIGESPDRDLAERAFVSSVYVSPNSQARRTTPAPKRAWMAASAVCTRCWRANSSGGGTSQVIVTRLPTMQQHPPTTWGLNKAPRQWTA